MGPLGESKAPNELWCVEFKGQFQLGNRRYYYPLTLSDHYSRYLLTCEALENTPMDGAWSTFEQAFKERGLPQAIRSDNKAPFSSLDLNGWIRLSVWWLQLGIELEQIELEEPEQNRGYGRIPWKLHQKLSTNDNSRKPMTRNDSQFTNYEPLTPVP